MSTSGGTTRSGSAGLRAAILAAGIAYVLCLISTAMAAFVVVNAAEDTCGFSEEGWGGWGEDSWSWLPLGQTCTYEVPLTQADGSTVIVRHVDPPSPFVTTTLVLLVVAPAAGVIGWRLRGQRAA